MLKTPYKYLIFACLAFAFLIRLADINYGLPLWLIGDEPPFTTATLKMIEEKTILPVLHQEAFKPTLYFPPYLAHIYLIPFILLLGIKFLLFNGGIEAFKNYIVSDLSQFFLLGRFINVILGTATVWLVYKISKNIFRKESIAILSAAFLASSILHIYLSAVARDWVPAVFLFTLAMYTLSNQNISQNKRYVLGGVISGIAFGVSLIAGFIMLFILFWYLFYEEHKIFDVFKEKSLYITLASFLALAGISIAIYPFGFHLSGDNSLAIDKSVYEYILSLINFLKPVLISEPLLVIFALMGLVASFIGLRKYFWTTAIFIFSYITIFYIVFHYEHRFTIYLFPILSILAGYGLYWIAKKLPNPKLSYALVILILAIPLATSLRLDWLILKNDSRIQARNWLELNIPEQSKILIHAEMTRLSSTPEAIKEQENIDSNSLRKIDDAERKTISNLHKYTQFHALNMYSVYNDEFYKNLPKYAQENNYQYLVIDPVYDTAYREKSASLLYLASQGELIKSFGKSQEVYFLRDGNFGNPLGLFKLGSLGPKIEIYKLSQQQ